jgi:hypothetical protein
MKREEGFDSSELFTFFDKLSQEETRAEPEAMALQMAKTALHGEDDPRNEPDSYSFFIRANAALNALESFPLLENRFLDKLIGQIIEKTGMEGLEHFESFLSHILEISNE